MKALLSVLGRRVQIWRAPLLLALLFVVSACQIVTQTPEQRLVVADNTYRTAAVAPPLQARAGSYRLKPGDRLSVYVFDNPDLVQNVVVGPDGRFNFPLVGSVRAEGRTLSTIEGVIAAELRKSILQPQVSVSLESIATERIYVTGEVITPGVFEITEPVTVMQALSMAGGFTAFAKRETIVIYNPASRTHPRRFFNYEAFLADPTAYDLALRPGDTVIVP